MTMTDPTFDQDAGLTPIERVRLAVIMRDSYADSMPEFEDVEELLKAYDKLLDSSNSRLERLERIRTAAERVCRFDWEHHKQDAIRAIVALIAALTGAGEEGE